MKIERNQYFAQSTACLVKTEQTRGFLISCIWKDSSLISYQAVLSLQIKHLMETEWRDTIQNIKGLNLCKHVLNS